MLDADISQDILVDVLKKSEFGFVLLKTNKYCPFDSLIKESSYLDILGMQGKDYAVCYRLYPLKVKGNNQLSLNSILEARYNAALNLFIRWTLAGYNKNHDKSPCSCIAFFTYLDSISFSEADYMILLEDN